jgi:hypothetical protein
VQQTETTAIELSEECINGLDSQAGIAERCDISTEHFTGEDLTQRYLFLCYLYFKSGKNMRPNFNLFLDSSIPDEHLN